MSATDALPMPVPSASIAADARARRPTTVAWIAIAVLGAVMGIVGAAFGAWLATRWW